VVLTQDPAAPGKSVLVEVLGGLYLAQAAQVEDETMGGDQRVRVVLALNAATTGKSVFVPVAGGVRLAQFAQVVAKVFAALRVRG
jgi:hypothetical protein